jgi:hypothetical protein
MLDLPEPSASLRDTQRWVRAGFLAAAGWSVAGAFGALLRTLLSDGGRVLPACFAVVAAGLAVLAWARLTDRPSDHWRRPVVMLNWTAALPLLFVLPTNLIMRLVFLGLGSGWT